MLRHDGLFIQDVLFLESLRNFSWFFLISILLSRQQFDDNFYLLRKSWQLPVFFLLAIAVLATEINDQLRYYFQQWFSFDLRLILHICFPVIGLMLIEQLYRNALKEQRWSIKFFCIALLTIFSLDFILYSKSLLFNELDNKLWESRGLVNTLVTPLLAIATKRLTSKQASIKVSNKVIFHTTILLGAGLYLLLMSLAGYYIKIYGGTWGSIAQISFVFLAILLFSIFFVSGKIRALAKVYLSKHIFQHRYDYREEWVKLSKTLAKFNSIDELSHFTIETLSNYVDSTGGGIWLRSEENNYILQAEYNLLEHQKNKVSINDKMVTFLSEKQWVIDFVEYFNDPDIYSDASLNDWHNEFENIWLIVPLLNQHHLIAFVILTEPRVPRQIDWEDHDFLKTAGMQLANALALLQASDDLSRARQFEAYNRFSAFLVHDLKNLVAQIALIVRNAEKHKHNPEFIDDSIETLENVVNKIEFMLGQLKKGNIQAAKPLKTELINILNDVILQQSNNKPVPALKLDDPDNDFQALVEKEKMTAILGHLIQNAQEATADDGQISLEMIKSETSVIIKIVDNGCGMDETFINQRLFKPFDTTKGNAGMGIGVYEAKEYINQQSGTIDVESYPGKGTTFTIVLPLA